MSILRKVAQLSVVAIFMILIAFFHTYSSAIVRNGRAHHEKQYLNQSLWNPTSKESRWTSLSHWKSPYTSSLSQQQTNPSQKHEEDYTRILVIPRLKADDVSWISKELPDLNVTVYVADDPAASLHPPKNKGHEVMVYLTYIIDHYDKLPDILIFMHAHRWTHHNNELLGHDAPQMIRRLSNAYVTRQGYVNMRCHWSPGCPEWLHPDSGEETLGKQEEAVLSESWAELFPSHPLPRTLSQACCAQFALSRQRVQSIPVNQYTFFRDWILRTPLSDYISGRIWEYTWQYLFTGQGVSCPAEHLCYCDGFGVCFGGDAEYNSYQKMLHTKKMHESQLKVLREQLKQPRIGVNVPTAPPTQSDELAYIHGQVKALDKELAAREKNALERGDDPRKRAEECGREWKEGDGF